MPWHRLWSVYFALENLATQGMQEVATAHCSVRDCSLRLDNSTHGAISRPSPKASRVTKGEQTKKHNITFQT